MTQSAGFRADIDEAIKALNLSTDQFRLVELHQHEQILVAILERFTTLGKKGLNYPWWWTSLKEPRASIYDDYAPSLLEQLLPPQEVVWFIAEDVKRTKRNGNFWLYEGTVAAIVQLLGELFAFEYYLVSKKFEWLVGEDHSGILIGVGEPIVSAITNVKASLS